MPPDRLVKVPSKKNHIFLTTSNKYGFYIEFIVKFFI
jgi:hypothetical protein